VAPLDAFLGAAVDGAVEEALQTAVGSSSAEAAKESARVEAEKAVREQAQMVAPRIDALKPRFEQFFRFVCPFCGNGEEIGLWFTSKTCAGCTRMSRIVRDPHRTDHPDGEGSGHPRSRRQEGAQGVEVGPEGERGEQQS